MTSSPILYSILSLPDTFSLQHCSVTVPVWMSTVVSTFWSKLVATCGTWTSVKRGVYTSPDLRFDHDDVISRNTVTSHLKSHQRYITYELADVSSYPLMYRYGDSVHYRWIYRVLHFLYPKFCVPHCGGCRGETCGNTIYEIAKHGRWMQTMPNTCRHITSVK